MNVCHGEETIVSGELGRRRCATGPQIAKKVDAGCKRKVSGYTAPHNLLRMSLRACRSVRAPTLTPAHHLKCQQRASQLRGSPTSCCQIPQNMQPVHLVRSLHAVTHPLCSVSSSSDQSADRKPERHRAGRGAGFPGLEPLPRCTEDAFEEKLSEQLLHRKLRKLTYSHQTSWV